MRRPRPLAATLTHALVHRSAFTGGNFALPRIEGQEVVESLGRYEAVQKPDGLGELTG
jgi:hypothetical protein